jgi:hypothetical protein
MTTQITMTQFLVGAYLQGHMIRERAIDMAVCGGVPDFMRPAFDSLSRQEQDVMHIRLARATILERAEPLVEVARISLGMTSQQMDDFFTYAATL